MSTKLAQLLSDIDDLRHITTDPQVKVLATEILDREYGND